jgi:hydrogenase nickel incorporation protein HypB
MKKKLEISAQERNREIARQNREFFAQNGIFVINIIGSPGCGKTSILEYMAEHFEDKFAVIVGDVKTALDSDRLLKKGHQYAYPIETGGGCHLTPTMISDKISQIDFAGIEYLFVENVGNLVCPSSFDLGEDLKLAVLSVPEGDEKVRKYPSLFLRAQSVIINKIDLLGLMDYDVAQVKSDCLVHNRDMEIFEISAKTGVGFDQWFFYLKKQKESKKKH